jgi:hypothetical protein
MAVAAVVAAQLPVRAEMETDAILPNVRAVSERVLQAEGCPGRKAIRYEHEHDPQWGYAKPETNFFNLVLPNRLTANPPLIVALHCAGPAANADERLPHICGPQERRRGEGG